MLDCLCAVCEAMTYIPLCVFLQNLKADLLENIETRLQELLDDFVHEVEKIEQASTINGIPHRSQPCVASLSYRPHQSYWNMQSHLVVEC